MANTLISPTIIAKEALRQLKNNLVMARLVHTDYSKEFNKVGSSINLRKPVKFDAKTHTAGVQRSNQDVEEGYTSLSIDKQKYVSWNFSSQELTLTVDQYSERYIKPAMIALSQQVESDLMGLYTGVPMFTSGTEAVGSNKFDYLSIGAARQKLVEHAAPMGETLNAVLNPSAALKIASDLKTLFQPEKTLTALERVKVGKYAGFDTYEAQSVKIHTVGKWGTTDGAVNGAKQCYNGVDGSVTDPQANSQSLITDGWDNSVTGILKAGDVITLAGVNDVNPVTKEDLGYLKQFVVTATANSGASTGPSTLTIAPAIITTGPYKNVTAAPADNAVIKVKTGASEGSYAQNLCFHKNAFALVWSDLEMPDGAPFKAKESDPDTGMTVRVVKQYDIDYDKDIIRMDILYGCKTIYPELAVRLSA